MNDLIAQRICLKVEKINARFGLLSLQARLTRFG